MKTLRWRKILKSLGYQKVSEEPDRKYIVRYLNRKNGNLVYEYRSISHYNRFGRDSVELIAYAKKMNKLSQEHGTSNVERNFMPV